MERATRVKDLRDLTSAWRSRGDAVALVPTMGNLHAGHMSLVELAGKKADRVLVSIFVNPTQFGPGEDFDSYPRTLEQDVQTLEASPCDAVFTPDQNDIYPHGLTGAVRPQLPSRLADTLEGVHRPGHFAGVASVVMRLFHAVLPDIAVFGEKDYQQLQVIRYLTRDLLLPVGIVAGRTVREADGLALSSRNRYLSADQRRRAPSLHRILSEVAAQLAAGDRKFDRLETQGVEALREAGFAPDYVAVRRPDLGAAGAGEGDFVVLAAASLGSTRLIDNIRSRAGAG